MGQSVVTPAKRQSVSRAYRVSVLLRAVCALGGGYVVSAAFAAAAGLVLVQYLGMSKPDAVTCATLLSFVVYAVVVLWVFACARGLHAWMVLVFSALALGLLTWVLYGGQA